jgi:hypothetical protein
MPPAFGGSDTPLDDRLTATQIPGDNPWAVSITRRPGHALRPGAVRRCPPAAESIARRRRATVWGGDEERSGTGTDMPPTQHQDRAYARSADTLDRLDLELQKAGNGWIDPDLRDRIAQAAETLGLHRTAARLRAANERRAGFERGPLRALPAPMRATTARSTIGRPAGRPILMAVPDDYRVPAGPTDAGRRVYTRLAAVYDELLTTPGLDDAARSSLLRQRRHAQIAAGLLPPAPPRDGH